MENYFKNSSIFELISRWKIHLLIIVIVAGGLGILFSSSIFITPKYSSYAVLYPANISPMSEESETEQMLELIQSQDIRFRVFDAFDLGSHYSISENDPHYLSQLNKRFEGSVSFRKTENEAVMLTVLDKDPQVASDMVDSIIAFYNHKVLNLNKDKSAELVRVYDNHLNKKQSEIDSLSKILKKHRKENNILDFGIQTKEYTRAIANGKSFGDTKESLQNLRDFGSDFMISDSLLWNAMSDYHEIKQQLEVTIQDTTKTITYAHVVAEPFAADKKSYPTRWIFVFFSVLGALFAGVVVLMFIDKARISKH
ncbi:MAG: hypothetical protein U9N51_07125 [Bacteroidota bacterium]|nr:hypothetical protein [Bacteroidota bacterium]